MFLAGLAAFVTIPLFLEHYSLRRRLLRRVRRSRRSLIHDVVAGAETAVVGRARKMGPLLEAPFWGLACLGWTVSVHRRSSNAWNDAGFEILGSRRSALTTGEGKCSGTEMIAMIGDGNAIPAFYEKMSQ